MRPLVSSVTQTPPPPTAMPRPNAPVGIARSSTRPLAASIRVTLRSPAFVTPDRPVVGRDGRRREADRDRLHAIRPQVDP